MSNIQQLVQQLGSGWTVVGTGNPVEETTVSSYTDPTSAGAPPQSVNRGTGRYYVIVQDPEGHQRALFLKAQPIKGGLEVKQSGVNDSAVGPDGRPDPSKPNPNLFTGDLKSLQWDQSGPVGDVPAGPKQPSKAEDLQKIGPNGQVIPPNDTTTKPVRLYDPKTGNSYDIPAGDKPIFHDFGDQLLAINPDGSFKVVANKPKDKSQFNVPGTGLVEYDPSKSGQDAYTVVIPTKTGMTAKDLGAQATQVRNGKTYVAVDTPDGINWQETNLPAQHTYTVAANDPRSKYITLIDENGGSTAVEKQGWVPPPSPAAGNVITPDTVSDNIVTIGDDGKPLITKNPNKLTISDAQRQLIQQLGMQVAAGSMSEDEAQKLITSATQVMTSQAQTQQAQNQQEQNVITAGGDVLTNIQNAAQTGAGILQNRVTNAQQLATGLLGQLQQPGPRFGNLQGGMLTAPPADYAQNLIQGSQAWATELGGGPDVYTSAANLVRRADPTGALGQDAANAYASFAQMLQKYRDMTGTKHPVEDLATMGTGGFRPPQTLYNPQASTATMNAAGFPDTPQGRAAAAASNPALLRTPQPSAQQYYPSPSPTMSSTNQVPGANYSAANAYTNGVMPWNAVPGPSFVSPPTLPQTPKVTVSVG